MAKIEEAIWQGQGPPGRFLCLHNAENLLTRSLLLLSAAPFTSDSQGRRAQQFNCGSLGSCSGRPEMFRPKGSEKTWGCDRGRDCSLGNKQYFRETESSRGRNNLESRF